MLCKVTIEGESYEWDGRMRLKEARTVFARTGLTPVTIFDGLAAYNPDAVAALVWMLVNRKEEVSFDALDMWVDDVEVEFLPDPTTASPKEAPDPATTSDTESTSDASPSSSAGASPSTAAS